MEGANVRYNVFFADFSETRLNYTRTIKQDSTM